MKRKSMTVCVAAIAIVMMPALALSSSPFSLTLIRSGYMEGAQFTGPDAPFAPYDITKPELGLDGIIEGLTGTVLAWFGTNPIKNIYGPGITKWENFCDIWGPDMYVQASAVGTIASFGVTDVILIGKTQRATHGWLWAAVYELTGPPGETADVRFDYTLDYTCYNLAIAGRSKAATYLDFEGSIVPASIAHTYDPGAFEGFPARVFGGNPLADASFRDHFSLKDGAEYKYLGGFKEATEQKAGSFNVGSMNVGDRLFISAALRAETECMVYHPPSLTVATMFPTLEGTLHAEEPNTGGGGGGAALSCFIATIHPASNRFQKEAIVSLIPALMALVWAVRRRRPQRHS